MKKKTIIYVDGFNLYYGCLKKSAYKWLDLKLLFAKLLRHSALANSQLPHKIPGTEIVKPALWD